MTAQLRATLHTAFENGDKPDESDFIDIFDSFLSLTDTTAQSVVSDIITPYMPEYYGAVGDGVTVDTTAVQACINFAESSKGNTVILNNSYLVSSVVVGAGTYSIKLKGNYWTSYPGDTTNFTFVKNTNAPALIVPTSAAARPFITEITIKGKGNADPSLTDVSADSTPGLLVQSRCNLNKITLYQTGGLSGYGEDGGDTIGSALCILQREGAQNVNGITAKNIVAVNCRGGVYVGKVASGVTNGTNSQAVQVECLRLYNIIGYGINGYGGRNRYYIQNFYGPSSTAQFFMRGDDSEAIADYAEHNTPLAVDFTGGTRNYVELADSTDYTTVNTSISSNAVSCKKRGITYLGVNANGYDPSFLGSTGVKFDAIQLPNAAADGYVKLTGASYTDHGQYFDIISSAVQGVVTWATTASRVALVSRVGALTQVALELNGEVATSSTNSSRLAISIPNLTFWNMNNKGGPACNLFLTNSAVTNKPVTLMYATTTNLSIREINGTAMTFDAVVGASAFSLNGTISLMARQGME